MTLSSYNPCAQQFRGNQQLNQGLVSFFFLLSNWGPKIKHYYIKLQTNKNLNTFAVFSVLFCT